MTAPKKFGTFAGVFTPSTEAILGTVLFLLFPLLTQQVGLFYMLIIVVLAHTVTISTAFSISDCATNLNSIGAGGMYALSRRSLGKAFGASIGIQLYLAQACSIAFYCIGFIEPLHPILLKYGLLSILPQDPMLQKQILSTMIFFIFFIIAMIGAHFITKLQFLILIILGLSIGAVFISPFLNIRYNDLNVFRHFNNSSLIPNSGISTALFFTAFTIFFPAVCGIDAGVGMSGDLKDPRKSLVRGTFLSITVTFIIYFSITFIYSLINPGINMKEISLINLLGVEQWTLAGSIVFIGILFATSSSALSCFMTAPRSAFALARQHVLPRFLNFLGWDIKKRGMEPRLATIFTLFIGLAVIWSGDIKIASQIVGICFLIVYGWMNFSAFMERISKNPNFRPTSWGSPAISFYGFIISIAIICLYNVAIGVLIIISQVIIFLLILKYKAKNKLEGVWWGVLFTGITWALKKLSKIVQGTKNWRPIVVAFTFYHDKAESYYTLKLAKRIAENQGLITANILFSGEEGKRIKQGNNKIYNIDIPQKQVILPANTRFEEAILSIVKSANIIGIDTNTVLIEYDNRMDWPIIIENIINQGKNLFIYKNGIENKTSDHIDVWWRGEKNGNMMGLIAYIIMNSDRKDDITPLKKIRIIRKLSSNESEPKAREEIDELILKARLDGESVIIPYDTKPISDTVKENSHSAKLIIFGMPGKQALDNKKIGGLKKLFNLNKIFFENEIKKFDDFPPLLFVEAAVKVDLIED
ncbi:MAG: amino acid permease [Spirochaetes bacterium]|nr:amino acid permease [Spirochaetota bacterium]